MTAKWRAVVPGVVAAALCAAAGVALARPAQAQLRKAPGAAIGQQVVVRVSMILADSADYVPLVREDLDVRGNPDSVTLTTDDAGVVTALMARGTHQVVTVQPVWWRGRRLTWSVPFDVHPGMSEVLLTLGNATVLDAKATVTADRITSVSGGAVAALPAPPTGRSVRVARGARVMINVDGAEWEVFEQQLGGIAPAPGGRASDSLFTLMFYRDGHARQLDGFPREWRQLSDGELATLFTKARTIEP